MRKLALIAFLLVLSSNAQFYFESTEVTVSNIQKDGSAKVHESIKLIMIGDYAHALYDTGFEKNDLSYWSATTELDEVKLHMNPSKLEIKDLRLRPQPRKKCNPIERICHGELLLDYYIHPLYNQSGEMEVPLKGTGLFGVESYKPRTTRYTINPGALSFTTTEQGNIILNEDVSFTIELPEDSVVLDINPFPEDGETALPARIGRLSWTDAILVKFTLIFDVEESLGEEVSTFFLDIITQISGAVSGPHGFALVVLVVIILGSYAYINASKKKKEGK